MAKQKSEFLRLPVVSAGAEFLVMGYPVCVEGECVCPPEDVGGVWGYAEFLEAISDAKHEQHEEMLHWRGPFEAEKFDADKATKAMSRGLADWRQYQ